MSALLYNLLNSALFWVLLGLWIFACIAWASRWRALFERIGKLLEKPVIFDSDENPRNVPLYPRTLFEKLARGFKDGLKQPLTSFVDFLRRMVSGIKTTFTDPGHPFRPLGYLIMLFAFTIFVLADTIAVSTSLPLLLGLDIPSILPPWAKFEYAVLGGSILALVLGFALYMEIGSDDSEITGWSKRSKQSRRSAQGLSLLVTIFSFLSIVFFALGRLTELRILPESGIISTLVSVVLYGIVPMNSALAAALVFGDAIRGLSVLGFLLGWFFIGILVGLNFILTALGTVVPVVLDILYRLALIIADIILWIISTPVMIILLPFKAISDLFKGGTQQQDQSKEE